MPTPRTRKPSDADAVDAYMEKLVHPLADLAAYLRQLFLKADRQIGEEIKWNAPAFFYAGLLPPSDPKLYRRYLVIFNFFRKDSIRLVFWHGANAKDPTGLLQGKYPDGRRLAVFHSVREAKAAAPALRAIVREQIRAIPK